VLKNCRPAVFDTGVHKTNTMNLTSAIHAFKRWGYFSWKEMFQLLITATVMGFVFSFGRYNLPSTPDQFNLAAGIFNFILFTLFSMLALLSMQYPARLMALKFGYIPKYQSWPTGIGISAILCVLTNGFPLYLNGGGIDLKKNEGLQLGYYWKGINMQKLGFIAFWGLFGLVFYTAIIAALPDWLINPYIKKEMIVTSILIGISSLIPVDALFSVWQHNLPHSNGTLLLFGKWAFGVFTLTFVAVGFSLIFFINIWALPIAIILGGIAWLAFRLFFIVADDKDKDTYHLWRK
jgi:hypothetical protein